MTSNGFNPVNHNEKKKCCVKRLEYAVYATAHLCDVSIYIDMNYVSTLGYATIVSCANIINIKLRCKNVYKTYSLSPRYFIICP